ncbi:uncharacterized protein LOC111260889 isoform X1 [Varroa jacobsoni]|uniref:uncharacterized protein LOC111260889 isoform X1 n=1 Tax=Varroa jacobsoni TaxID=62625 RepID=UPI000BF307EB|nr:uncharacterized protein LOC111260889 isoform X1 [Varroa jacobsoni]
MAMTSDSLQQGDKVIIQTRSGRTFEGTFKTLTPRQTLVLSKARSNNGESYGETELQLKQIRSIYVIEDCSRALRHDPAIVRAELPRGGNRQHTWNNYNKQNNAKLNHPITCSQPNSVPQRRNQGKAVIHGNRSWPRQTARGMSVHLFRENLQSPRRIAAKHRQTKNGTFQDALLGHLSSFRQIRRHSEGVFVQRHPGMAPISTDDYDLVAETEKFTAMQKLKSSRENNAEFGEAQDLSAKKNNEDKSTPVTDFEKFFDHLKLSNDHYEPDGIALSKVELAAYQTEQQRKQNGYKYSTEELKSFGRSGITESLVQTFGEEDVNNLYPQSLQKFNNSNNSHRKSHHNQQRLFFDNNYMTTNYNDSNSQRNSHPQDYRPTVNFQRNYRGANPRFSRNAQDKSTAMFGSLMHSHTQQLLSGSSGKKKKQLSSCN